MTEGQWQFHFDAFKGTRILRSRFFGITTSDLNLWWSYEHKKWLPLDECGVQGASSTAPCRSFKAFKSHLRRHPELQTGATITLASWFVGHDITARWYPKLSGYSVHMVIVDEFHPLSKAVGSEGL